MQDVSYLSFNSHESFCGFSWEGDLGKKHEQVRLNRKQTESGNMRKNMEMGRKHNSEKKERKKKMPSGWQEVD